MTDPINQPYGATPAAGTIPQPGVSTSPVNHAPPLWAGPPNVPQPPSSTGPLIIGAACGAVTGAVLGFLGAWILVIAALGETGRDFGDVDGGRFLSLLMLFSLLGALSGGVSGLLIGAMVGSNRKSRFRAQHGLPQPWQPAPAVAPQQQFTPAPQMAPTGPHQP
ncbi:hypothetical protein [Prescottella agglutinans]|uniref:DUF4190 domain-containing protein n=1 Tax=Prescottella agglutinans TaxID=1644129 RepID=A0ABT6MI59_9NOCA|nr:hypothetical protein [Prescottella agglutinans]MDH6284008.1 hypothetical protein [Prescottella agglutinans]